MVDIMEYNKLKRIELVNRIVKCNGKYRLFCIDVDDVVFNTDPVMQEVLENFSVKGAATKATKKYREQIAKETSEDSLAEMKKSFAMLDAILEETEYEYDIETLNGFKIKRKVRFDEIDYEKIYSSENLFKNAVEFINFMIANKGEDDFFIYLSHRNPVREGETKTRRLYELTPGIDAVVTLPYHIEFGSKDVNSKGLWIKQYLDLDNLDNCYLIDNSKSNGKDWRKHGGIDIRYLPSGFSNSHSLSDHMAKLADLDPYNIQFCIAYIEYARNHPEYSCEKEMIKVKK